MNTITRKTHPRIPRQHDGAAFFGGVAIGGLFVLLMALGCGLL